MATGSNARIDSDSVEERDKQRLQSMLGQQQSKGSKACWDSRPPSFGQQHCEYSKGTVRVRDMRLLRAAEKKKTRRKLEELTH